MINAVRTLLLNQDGASSPGIDYPGEEYVPPGYTARVLAPALKVVSQALFGQRPDRAKLNYRLKELMTILHTTELKEFVTDIDSRITYDMPSVLTNSFFTELNDTPTVIQTAGSDSQLYTVAPADNQATSDQLFNQWSIVITDGSHVTVTQLSNPYNVPPVTVATYTITNGLSSLITLPGTNCAVRWQDQIGAAWIVTWILRPLDTLVDVGNNLAGALSPDVLAVLFGVQPVEPYLTFKNLWEFSPHLAYRLAGVALALAYRTNELVS